MPRHNATNQCCHIQDIVAKHRANLWIENGRRRSLYSPTSVPGVSVALFLGGGKGVSSFP